MHCKTECLSCDLFGYSRDLEHNTSGLNYCYPELCCSFTGTHSGFSGLCCNGLIREDLDPNLTATLNVTGHGNTGCLYLVCVVSEETGNISFVQNGTIKTMGSITELRLAIENSFK